MCVLAHVRSLETERWRGPTPVYGEAGPGRGSGSGTGRDAQGNPSWQASSPSEPVLGPPPGFRCSFLPPRRVGAGGLRAGLGCWPRGRPWPTSRPRLPPADLADGWTWVRLFLKTLSPAGLTRTRAHTHSHTHTQSVRGRQGRTPSGPTQSLEVIPPPATGVKHQERKDTRDSTEGTAAADTLAACAGMAWAL